MIVVCAAASFMLDRLLSRAIAHTVKAWCIHIVIEGLEVCEGGMQERRALVFSFFL